ncbi:MlaD family protein [Cellvibrio sp. ARAG 10.3]|uniref:MlaD family protein n=1 Tax=Cellvibrio sp. ARAG 10.3 TaxID=3451358 RepID=UPI003F472FF0
MSHKKNRSLAIGAFIVGAILLVFIALMFFSGGRFFADKKRVVMYFEGSVQGLQVGAPVKLKGVVLGEIIDISINFERDNKTVYTAVTADLVMKRINSDGVNVEEDFFEDAIQSGLRAQLNFQSFLTGLLYVELDFYPDSELRLYAIQKEHQEIPTIGTSFEEISRTFQELDLKGLVHNLNNLTEQVSNMVANGQVAETLSSFNRLATSLEQTSGNADKEIARLSAKMDTTLTELNTLIKQLNTQTPDMLASLKSSLQELDKSMQSFDQAAANIEHAFSEDAPLINQLTRTLEDMSRSSQAFRSLSETLEQQPEALLRGRSILPEEE